MKRAFTRKRHRPEEIVTKLRETDAALSQGKTLEDVAKSLDVSLMTLHQWRTVYGSTDRDAVKCLKELERKNGRLKRLVADQSLDIHILKEVACNFKSSREFYAWRNGVGPSNTSQFPSASGKDEYVAWLVNIEACNEENLFRTYI